MRPRGRRDELIEAAMGLAVVLPFIGLAYYAFIAIPAEDRVAVERADRVLKSLHAEVEGIRELLEPRSWPDKSTRITGPYVVWLEATDSNAHSRVVQLSSPRDDQLGSLLDRGTRMRLDPKYDARMFREEVVDPFQTPNLIVVRVSTYESSAYRETMRWRSDGSTRRYLPPTGQVSTLASFESKVYVVDRRERRVIAYTEFAPGPLPKTSTGSSAQWASRDHQVDQIFSWIDSIHKNTSR